MEEYKKFNNVFFKNSIKKEQLCLLQGTMILASML